MTTISTPAKATTPSAARALGGATVMTIAFVLLSRVLGVIRNMVISYVFGQNETTTIYIRAFAVPDTLYLMMAGGALSAVFIPVFTEYLKKKNEEQAWRVFGQVITLVAVSITAVILLAELLAYPLSRLAAPKFSEAAVQDMVPLTRILLPAQFFFFTGSLIIATLQARERWFFPNLAPVVYNACIILGALLFGAQVGPVAMTWGAVIGAGIGNFLLPLFDLSRSGIRWHFGFQLRDLKPLPPMHPNEDAEAYEQRVGEKSGLRKFIELLLPAMLGLGLSALGFLITGFFLGEGPELTALRNGYDLTQAPIGIFAQASALVLFPTLSRLAAEGNREGLRDELDAGLRRILFLTVPASLLMAVLAEPIITLLYANARFGSLEMEQAAISLRLYSFGTFAWSAQAVVGRGFFALQNTKTPLKITKFMVVLFVSLCLISTLIFHLPFGALAVSMTLVGTVNMLWLLFALRDELPGLDLRNIAIGAGRIVAVAAVASVLAWGISRLFPITLPNVAPVLAIEKRLKEARDTGAPETQIAQLKAERDAQAKPILEQTRPMKLRGAISLLAAGGAGVVTYGLLAFLLRLPELRTIRALFRRKA